MKRNLISFRNLFRFPHEDLMVVVGDDDASYFFYICFVFPKKMYEGDDLFSLPV